MEQTMAKVCKGKPYYTRDDIMEILDVSQAVAQRIMREIKAYSNTLNVKGRVAVEDFDAYMRRQATLKNKQNEGSDIAFAMVSGLIRLLTPSQIQELLRSRGLQLAKYSEYDI